MNDTPNYSGPLPDGWTGGEAVTKWWRGNYVHLYKLRKPCAQCQRTMEINVTRAALDGTAKNAGLHLTRCKDCRKLNAISGKSRPTVQGAAPATEQERSIIETMKAEVDALYAENAELRKRLEKYELAPAMEAARPKMPWETS